MKPSVGRTVHYVSYGTPGGEYKSECRAAIVTEVGEVWVPEDQEPPEGTPVGLAVLNPSGMFFNRGVMQHEGDTGSDHSGEEIPAKSYRGGTWHWPERVPE
jgi:hypothetical protein